MFVKFVSKLPIRVTLLFRFEVDATTPKSAVHVTAEDPLKFPPLKPEPALRLYGLAEPT